MPSADLQRFVTAQDEGDTFAIAMRELTEGHKESHWMWFVFPQITGLGSSPMARRYSLTSVDEAAEYLTHPVLGPRLLQATKAVLDVQDATAIGVLGTVDAMKLLSSMTLFHRADPDEPLFAQVLERFFAGTPDAATDAVIAKGG